MRRYNILIADYDGNIVEETPISEYTIINDYLTPTKSTVTLPYITSAKPEYRVEIYNPAYEIGISYRTVYEGIITDVIYEKNISIIYLHTLYGVINKKLFHSQSTLANGLEDWFNAGIDKLISTNADSKMNWDLVSAVNYATGTLNADIGTEENLVNLYSLLSLLLFKYNRKVMTGFFGTYNSIFYYILKVNDDPTYYSTIETNNPSVVSVRLDFPNNIVNKVIYINEADNSQSVTYYLKTDGTISTNSTDDRILPVNQEVVMYNPDSDFAAETAILAQGVLQVSNDNYLIEMEVEDRKVLGNTLPLSMLQRYRIMHKGVEYVAIMTGFEILTDITSRLTFGAVRADLTTLLGLERR